MRKCSVKDCDKPLRNPTGKVHLCEMHKARINRHGSVELKKDTTDRHGLEKMPHLIVNDIIRDNIDKKDKDIVFVLIEMGFKDASVSNIRYRRRKLGLKKYKFDGKHYSKKLARETYGEVCEICTYDLTVDVHHIIERKNGGSDELDNLCILCPNCHSLIHRGVLSSMDSRKDLSMLKKELDKLL